jgi:AcrR family transcriptional regulator
VTTKLSPAPLRRDAAANRERLIVAAVEVFNDEGIEAGVEQIAQRAGVGIGTLYRRFPTKDVLIAHLVDTLVEEMIEAADAAREVTGGHGLERYVREMAELLATHRGCLARLWGGGTLKRLTELRRRQARLLHDAQEAGAIRADITASDLVLILWSLRGIVDASGNTAAAACQRQLDFVFAGLRPAAAAFTHAPLTARDTAPTERR